MLVTGGETELAARQDEIAAAKAVLSTLTAAQGEAEARSSSLTAEIEHLEETFDEKQDAIGLAEAELGELKEKIVGQGCRIRGKTLDIEREGRRNSRRRGDPSRR